MDNKTISIKSLLLGVGLAWIIPSFLFGVFWFLWESCNQLWLGVPGMLFLSYGGITQFVYIMPLIYWFWKKGNLGLVRGLWIGVISIIIGNICAVILFNQIEEKARKGTTKGKIEMNKFRTPYYGDTQKP